MMTKLPASLRAASALAIATATLAPPAPALPLGWDRISKVAPANFKDECGTPMLRAADNRALRVAAGGSFDIEVLGHGIDLVSDSDIQFDGGRVSVLRRHGGAENAGRKCGPIGSVKLRLRVNAANPEVGAPAERGHTLRIEDQRIPITAILPAIFQNFGWDRQSFRSGERSAAGTSGGLTGANSPLTAQSGQSCQTSQGCGGGGGTTGFVIPSQGGAGASTPSELSRHLMGCIRGRGGDVHLVDNRLEITLPDDRNSVRDCITRPTFARVVQLHDRADLAVGQSPAIRYSLRGGEGATTRPGSDPDTARFELNRDFAMSMVGIRDYQLIATNFASRQLTLDIRVQSVLPYGVIRVTPAGLRPPSRLTASPGRFSRNPAAELTRPSVAFDIDLAPSDATARPLEWNIAGPGASCFTTASGTLSPPAGVQRVSLTLERVSAAVCTGQNVTVTVAPAGRSNLALYAKSGTMTLN